MPDKEAYRCARETLLRDWDRVVTFYQFPQNHWRHLRTTNMVESPFAGLWPRTNLAKRYKKVEIATAIIWKILLLTEQRFCRLDATDKLMQVCLASGFREINGETEAKWKDALALH